jgi:chemotaxis protein histidine kinase CheA
VDIRSIIAPVILDKEGLREFMDALADHAPNIERDVARLKNAPGEREVLANLFRSVHNIKGDAALSKIELAVAIAHPIETVLARFRGGEIGFSDVVAEAILLSIDRLELAVEGLASDKSLDALRLLPLVQGLEKLALAVPSEVDACASELIERVTGFRPTATTSNAATASISTLDKASSAASSAQTRTTEDLRFFRTLAYQLEGRSTLFKGRTTRILRLAQETNQLAGQKIDPLQLEAAVYMHDVGMMFLPESVWLKVERITLEEKAKLRTHTEYSAGILSRIEGWSAAAVMVEQHHEMPDGAGYPRGIESAEICDGAKLLGIVDAFEAVMLKHIQRGRNRSVLRAIAEVNACDKQFAPEWTEPFNRVIRRSVEA